LDWVTTWVGSLIPQYIGEARCVAEDKNGSFYSGGDYGYGLGLSYLFKLGSKGDTLASYRIIENQGALGGNVKTINFMDDTTLVVGTQYGFNTTDNWWSLNKTDTLGTILNQRNEEELFIFTKGIITFDGKIVILGLECSSGPWPPNWVGLYKFNKNLEYDSIYTVPRTYDSLCPHPIVSDTIAMPDNCITVSLPELPVLTSVTALKVFPNPASNYVTIEVPEFIVTANDYGHLKEQQFRPLSGKVLLNVYNLEGRLIKSEEFSGDSRNYCLDISNWSTGMYSIQLSQKGKRFANGKFIKK